MIKNAELWNRKGSFDKDFYFIVEYINEKIMQDGIGSDYSVFGGDFLHVPFVAGEWGYAITHLDSVVDDEGNVHGTYFTGDKAPTTREEALEKIFTYLNKHFLAHKDESAAILSSINGHYPWHHYAGMAGYNNIGTEIGENIASYQLRLAMNRGAAKQYGASWFVDFSQWYGPYILDYKAAEAPTWNNYSSVDGGHSLNLMERSLLLAFMEGADAVVAEGGEHIAYDINGKLTPYGELCKKLNIFTSNYADRGTAYTPYAFILDKYHGMDMMGNTRIFGTFLPEIYDEFTYNIFNTYIWQGTLIDPCADELTTMTNTRYGEVFDMLLQDASAELLGKYPVLIFTGNIVLSEDELHKYIAYVENGGTLVLNTAYLKQLEAVGIEFPSLNSKTHRSVAYGKGRFMIYGEGGMFDICDENGNIQSQMSGDWQIGGLKAILDELSDEYMPFKLSEKVGYAVSVNDDTIYLMLFNNNGVSKKHGKPATIDENERLALTVEYTDDYSIASAEDIYNGHEVSLRDKTLSIQLEAGGIAIIELKLGKHS